MSDTDDLLRQVLERLDRMEARLDAVQSKIPQVIELAASSAEFAWSQAEAAGIDPIRSGQIAANLALVAGKEDNLRLIERALAQTALLGRTLDQVEKLDADGTIDLLMVNGAAMAPSLAKLAEHPGLRRVMDFAVENTQVVDTAEAATTALVETRKEGFQPLGLFGQIGMLMDGDVQKAIGFTLAIAKRFGQKL